MTRNLAATTMATVLSIVAGLPAYGAQTAEEVLMDEARSCVAAIGERVDVDGVRHVRHVVTDYEYGPVGFALRIRSEYETDAGDATYRAYCLADGTHAPLRLRVREIDG